METTHPITIFAHRGIHHKHAENTLKSFEEIKKYKNTNKIHFGIELDIQPTKQGKLICYHDPNLLKLHGNPIKTYDLTDKDLETYNIPTIDQIINCFKYTEYVIDFELKFYNDLHNENDIISTCNKITEILTNKKLNFFISSFNFYSLFHLSQISNFNLYLISDTVPHNNNQTVLTGFILRKNIFSNELSKGFYTIFGIDTTSWDSDTIIMKDAIKNNKNHLFIITDNVKKCLEFILYDNNYLHNTP